MGGFYFPQQLHSRMSSRPTLQTIAGTRLFKPTRPARPAVSLSAVLARRSKAAYGSLTRESAMDLQIDEKVCPFCFEVIKKQARRCRYCHADFDAGALGPGSFDTQRAVQGITIGGSGHNIEGGV